MLNLITKMKLNLLFLSSYFYKKVIDLYSFLLFFMKNNSFNHLVVNFFIGKNFFDINQNLYFEYL